MKIISCTIERNLIKLKRTEGLMMKTKSLATIIVFGTTLFLTSCKPDTSSSLAKNASVTTGFTITGSAKQTTVAQTNTQKILSLFLSSAVALPPPTLVDSVGASVTLGEAWMVIKEIEFEAQEIASSGEVDGDEIEFEGPFYVDLLSASPVSFGDASIPEVGLKRIKMQLHMAESAVVPAAAPAGLVGNSIYLSAKVGSTNFTYASSESTEFEISGANPIIPKASQDLLAVIKISDLFKKIDLSAISSASLTNISASNKIAVASNPCPLIDKDALDLYSCFRKGLASEANFGNDNGDMDLDDNDESVKK